MAFARGDVVLIPFPYADLTASKTRPTVVVSTPKFQKLRGELLVAYLTSQINRAQSEFDYRLRDWQSAGLLKPTLMQPRLAVITDTLVQHHAGSLTTRDLNEVNERLKRALGLNLPN